MKRKLKKVSAAATQRGKLGEKKGAISGSDNLPPKNAPKIKDKPAKTERKPKFLTLAFSVALKSETAARQTDILLEKRPVKSLPAKRSQRTRAPILQAVIPKPTRVKNTLTASAFFRPLRSAYSPRIGAPRNCPREKAVRKQLRIVVRVASDTSRENKTFSGSRK